ncbi:hypothetical protein HK104_007394, partial [Borealophlyctis nickersoniae]
MSTNVSLHTCGHQVNKLITQLKGLCMFERKVATALKDRQDYERELLARFKDANVLEDEDFDVFEHMKDQMMEECRARVNNYLAGRLDNVDFGFENTALDETILKEFVEDADTFQWFKERFPQIAESMEEGLNERIIDKFEGFEKEKWILKEMKKLPR